MDPAYRRALWLVIGLNGAMFILEMLAGAWSGSKSLQADALDFLGDFLTYSLSFIAIGWTPPARARAALFKGTTLILLAIYVFGSTLYQVLMPTPPEPFTMGIVAMMAFGANLLSVLLLIRWRAGDANIRSVWLCSRNDMLANIAVLIAAMGVFGTGTAWPDLIVATLMAGLFLHSARLIIQHSIIELRGQCHHQPV